jgi:hypothetical protein
MVPCPSLSLDTDSRDKARGRTRHHLPDHDTDTAELPVLSALVGSEDLMLRACVGVGSGWWEAAVRTSVMRWYSLVSVTAD